jgi:ATP-dependent Clp protease protease subunit
MAINAKKPVLDQGDEDEQQVIPLDGISLNTLGAHLLFGEINTPSVYQAVNFIIKSNFVFDHDTQLTMIVNSPGGSVSDGFALIDVMETSRLDITTVGIGQVASMGVLIVSAGTKGKRIITKNTEIMAHQFSTMVYGKYHELVASQKYHEQLEKMFIKHFMKHTTMTEKQVKDIMFSPTDRWLTPAEAKKYGICDEVREHMV